MGQEDFTWIPASSILSSALGKEEIAPGRSQYIKRVKSAGALSLSVCQSVNLLS